MQTERLRIDQVPKEIAQYAHKEVRKFLKGHRQSEGRELPPAEELLTGEQEWLREHNDEGVEYLCDMEVAGLDTREAVQLGNCLSMKRPCKRGREEPLVIIGFMAQAA